MNRPPSHASEYKELLQVLKSTAEKLLNSQVSNVWNIYGGLSRLHQIVEKIFKHGCRVFNQDGDPDCWIFIQGLNSLEPKLEVSSTVLQDMQNSERQLPSSINNNALAWIYKNLEEHTLSHKLSLLLTNKSHLFSCFEPTAFLCQESYGYATVICLKAIEQNLPELLTDIDPNLYLSSWNTIMEHKTHRRCSSFPEVPYRRSQDVIGNVILKKQASEDMCRVDNSNAFAIKFEVKCTDDKNVSTLPEPQILSENIVKVNCNILGKTIEKVAYFKENQNIHKQFTSLPNLFETNIHSNLLRERSLTVSDISYLTLHASDVVSPVQEISSSPDSFSQSKLSPSVLEVDYLSESHPQKTTTPSKNANVLLPSAITINPRISNNADFDKVDSVTSSKFQKAECVSCSHESSSKSCHKTNNHNRPSNLLPSSDLNETNLIKLKEQKSCKNDKQQSSNKQRRIGIVGSAPEYAGEWPVDHFYSGRRYYKKSFIEDGGNSVLPMSTCYFPRPQEGQSLTSFLSSGQFARTSAELDRENAHFSISEAMIAAIEQVKCNHYLRISEEGEDSDEEINRLKQRIRLRRRQKQQENRKQTWGAVLLSDGKTDTTTTDQSVSPISSSSCTPSESISTDDVDDLEVDEVSNLAQLKNSGLSVSMASLYSEAELSRHPPPRTGTDLALTESIVSAESVALSLIRQFSEKQLPRASDLQWLVSEQDAPQQLLPLPKSWPVSPDEAEDLDMHEATTLRGTIEWAPPRPQVIFTSHPSVSRKVLLAKQNYRCAGCGMQVASEYAHRFRYCEYLGRYFCTGCHKNQLQLIPGKILAKWDFTRCPVSNFSFRLLDQMLYDPLFRIDDLNNNLYRKAKALESTRQLRLQLYFLKDFVLTCRFAEDLQEELRKEFAHLLTEVDLYSLQDLLQVKSGELPTRLKRLVQKCSDHVDCCQLCLARGFICESCCAEQVIFPWQFSAVFQCPECGTCFHKACRKPSGCPRCKRRSERKKKSEDTS